MKTKILAVVLAFAANAAFAGSITNGDFASGNLSGWTTNGGSVNVGTNSLGNFADLYAGLGTGVNTILSQTVFLDAGDVLSGSAQFFAHDYLPFNDNAFVSINGVDVFASSVAAVGNYGTSALTSFSWTALTTGDYVINAGVANQLDNGMPSELQVSNFGVVPEPASIALMGLGFVGMAFLRRKAAGSNKA